MKKVWLGAGIVIVLLIGVSAIQQDSGPSEQSTITTSSLKEPSRVGDYDVYSLELPSSLDFSGEIEPILAEEGIPNDFKYLAVIESGLANVKSPAGAAGFWQIMKTTGRELGLEVNDNVDERYHLEKATRAACKYLKQSKARFGSWTLAAAAYNAGNAGINRELERQQVNDYYDLLLNAETGRYMFRILALKEILKDPESFGFNVASESYYYQIPTEKKAVDYEISDLAAFAKANNINYKVLKIHNPWLRENKLNNKSKKLYQIEIPLAGYYD